MGQVITLTARDGVSISGYRSDAAGARKGALVVIQEIFGVNHHIRNVCDRSAALGYAVVAPAVFDRVQKGVELGYDEAGIAAGRALMGKVSMDTILADTQAAIDYAVQLGKVGIVGYCLGGSIAFMAATRLSGITSAVGYYGGRIAAVAEEKPKVPTILHFGDKDQSIPMSDVDKIKAARPDVTIYVYPAGHGFVCDERASYDEASAKIALERTLAHFQRYVG